MKRIATTLLMLIVLISASGCFTATQMLSEKRFDTLGELKAAAGDKLLYPAGIAFGSFEPAYGEISGYDDYTSWNYRIILRSDQYVSDADDPDLLRRNAPDIVPDEGAPVIAYIFIYAFAPRSPYVEGGRGTQWPNMWEEIDAHEHYEQLAGHDPWKIGGMDVRHYSSFAAIPASDADSGKTSPAYTFAWAYAGFMRDGLLYMVETRAYGHPDEAEDSMLAMCESMLETIVEGMLHSDA